MFKYYYAGLLSQIKKGPFPSREHELINTGFIKSMIRVNINKDIAKGFITFNVPFASGNFMVIETRIHMSNREFNKKFTQFMKSISKDIDIVTGGYITNITSIDGSIDVDFSDNVATGRISFYPANLSISPSIYFNMSNKKFNEKLTQFMRSVSKDKRLRVVKRGKLSERGRFEYTARL